MNATTRAGARWDARKARGAAEAASQGARQPLTAQQHILHLLLTVVTGGLWAPVWALRAVHGNRR